RGGEVQVLPVSNHSGGAALGVSIDPVYAKSAKDLYGSIDQAREATENPSSAFEFGKAVQATTEKKDLSVVTALPVSKIAIGNVHVLNAKEKGLKIEPSTNQEYDVYWVQMAINPYEDLRSKLDELSFFVSLKTSNAEVFDLVPLRFVQEEQQK